MAGVIVSSNVAGGIAGGNVIPEPVWPSYATYPDVEEKDDQSLRSIFLANLNRFLGRVVDAKAPAPQPPQGRMSSAPSWAGPLVIALVVIFVVAKVLR